MDETTVATGYIVDFHFDRTSFPEAPALALTLRRTLESQDGETHIVFTGVSDLRVTDLNSFLHCILLAQDVRHWQHDGVRYVVQDNEGAVICFKCLGWTT